MKKLEITSIKENDFVLNNNQLFHGTISYNELEFFRKSIFTTCALAMEQVTSYGNSEHIKKSIDEIRFVLEFVGKITLDAECDLLDELRDSFNVKKKADFTFFLSDNEAIDSEKLEKKILVHNP